MAATLENLEQRLELLERDICELRALLPDQLRQKTTVERETHSTHDTRINNGDSRPYFKEMLEQFGITGEPIGAEEVQKMMLAEGVRPEDCIFSREIIAMREE